MCARARVGVGVGVCACACVGVGVGVWVWVWMRACVRACELRHVAGKVEREGGREGLIDGRQNERWREMETERDAER